MLQRYTAAVPPGFEGQPFVYLMTVFSLLMISLLTLEWMWRVAWGWRERPHPLQHPVTIFRIILFGTGLQIIMRVVPDVIRFAMWRDLTPHGRYLMNVVDHYLDTLSFVPMSVAWLTAYLTIDILHYQLSKKPLPVHLWPTLGQLKRPLKIGVGVFIISAAIVLFG